MPSLKIWIAPKSSGAKMKYFLKGDYLEALILYNFANDNRIRPIKQIKPKFYHLRARVIVFKTSFSNFKNISKVVEPEIDFIFLDFNFPSLIIDDIKDPVILNLFTSS